MAGTAVSNAASLWSLIGFDWNNLMHSAPAMKKTRELKRNAATVEVTVISTLTLVLVAALGEIEISASACACKLSLLSWTCQKLYYCMYWMNLIHACTWFLSVFFIHSFLAEQETRVMSQIYNTCDILAGINWVWDPTSLMGTHGCCNINSPKTGLMQSDIIS